jgi:protoporphyrinogen oxidase
MKWWLDILPVQNVEAPSFDLKYHGRQTTLENSKSGPDPEKEDKVFLIRHRLSRIFFMRKFFNYPVSADLETLMKLGFGRSVRIVWSYLWSQIFPKRPEVTLEDFFINRFGKVLYHTFFKDYTQKVWGKPPKEITADWGRQRVKSLSVSKAILHSVKKLFGHKQDIYQKNTETSLIEQFLYPKFGPGQMWEEVARRIVEKGGEVLLNREVTGMSLDGDKIVEIEAKDQNGNIITYTAGYYFSTMPVKELINSIRTEVPEQIKKIAKGLEYRDFITTGLLLRKLKKQPGIRVQTANNLLPDNWIYLQENDVKLGRIQIINNWSPYMVDDQSKVWLGLEYFCSEGDELWQLPDEDMKLLAKSELEKIGMIDASDVIDSTVIRMAKTYPGYFGSYNEFDKIIDYADGIENLFLIGRNGMHKYNNQDHSMLTAMTAVDNIVNGVTSKANIWAVNTEEEYHEGKD